MRGSYGLLLALFGLIVMVGDTLDPAFVPMRWLQVVHLAFSLGVAWAAVAVLVRVARSVLTRLRRG